MVYESMDDVKQIELEQNVVVGDNNVNSDSVTSNPVSTDTFIRRSGKIYNHLNKHL